MKMNKKLKLFIVFVLCFAVICCTGFGIYVSDYYRANDTALEATFSDNDVTVIEKNGDYMVFTPEKPRSGLIFYPGGKVEYTAYAELMFNLAELDILCVLVEMPLNFAIFGMNKAEDIIEEYDIENWYIMGHSLGAAIGASFAGDNKDKISGVIMLAGYSTSDLEGLEVLSIYGNNDNVHNIDKYNEYKNNMGTNYTEYIIDGGNHAYFGCYGEQKGDGKALITRDKQINLTVNKILEFLS
jgi:hypothetical protein